MLLSAGKTLASTGDLTGAEVPSLITVGRDGAVFFWVYEPLPHSIQVNGHPKRTGNIPGKRRKRKAPGADLETAEAVVDEDRVSDAEVDAEAAEDDDSSSSDSDAADDSSTSESTSGSEAGQDQTSEGGQQRKSDVEGGLNPEADICKADQKEETSSRAEASRQKEVSTSGRDVDGQSQSTSYAGTAHTCVGSRVCLYA